MRRARLESRYERNIASRGRGQSSVSSARERARDRPRPADPRAEWPAAEARAGLIMSRQRLSHSPPSEGCDNAVRDARTLYDDHELAPLCGSGKLRIRSTSLS